MMSNILAGLTQVWEDLQLASQTESHVKMDAVFHQTKVNISTQCKKTTTTSLFSLFMLAFANCTISERL